MLIRLRRCADVQAGLRLCCLQTPKDKFCRGQAHLSLENVIPCIVLIRKKCKFIPKDVAVSCHLITGRNVQDLSLENDLPNIAQYIFVYI